MAGLNKVDCEGKGDHGQHLTPSRPLTDGRATVQESSASYFAFAVGEKPLTAPPLRT